VLLIFGGVSAFEKLEKKEDSPFVIKQVSVVTSYPGATPREVEELITEPIERTIQSMRNIRKIKSESYFGLSKIDVFRADIFLPEGYTIYNTEKDVRKMEEFLMKQPSVKTVSVTMGGSPLRYYLASASFGARPNYANLLIELDTQDSTRVYEQRFEEYMQANFPNIWIRSSLFNLAPAVETPIEISRSDSLLL
jgi:multidrug efflux pump subunit AcrB